jgi:hypothetical protein
MVEVGGWHGADRVSRQSDREGGDRVSERSFDMVLYRATVDLRDADKADTARRKRAGKYVPKKKDDTPHVPDLLSTHAPGILGGRLIPKDEWKINGEALAVASDKWRLD